MVESNLLSSGTELLTPFMQKDEMPLIFFSSLTEPMVTKPIPWIFGGGPGIGAWSASFMKWIKDNWTGSRPPRVGIFTYDYASGHDFIKGSKYAP